MLLWSLYYFEWYLFIESCRDVLYDLACGQYLQMFHVQFKRIYFIGVEVVNFTYLFDQTYKIKYFNSFFPFFYVLILVSLLLNSWFCWSCYCLLFDFCFYYLYSLTIAKDSSLAVVYFSLLYKFGVGIRCSLRSC